MDEKLFGISEKALSLCEDRAVMLTNNLVNASTPHYKARDIDFQKALSEMNDKMASGLDAGDSSAISDSFVKYRIPMQKSLDGNTVDDEIERKNFLQNALHYQVNLTFVQNKADELMKAIKGD